MKRVWSVLVVGVVLIVVGLVWTLQGFDVLGGSAMSGSTLWAVVGPIVLVVGLALFVVAIMISRRGRTR